MGGDDLGLQGSRECLSFHLNTLALTLCHLPGRAPLSRVTCCPTPDTTDLII